MTTEQLKAAARAFKNYPEPVSPLEFWNVEDAERLFGVKFESGDIYEANGIRAELVDGLVVVTL